MGRTADSPYLNIMRSCYIDKSTRAIADLCRYPSGGLYLTRINVPMRYRGKGVARALLCEILKDADREGVTIHLTISPSDGLNHEQLEAWYRRAGFESDDNFCFVRVPRVDK